MKCEERGLQERVWDTGRARRGRSTRVAVPPSDARRELSEPSAEPGQPGPAPAAARGTLPPEERERSGDSPSPPAPGRTNSPGLPSTACPGRCAAQPPAGSTAPTAPGRDPQLLHNAGIIPAAVYGLVSPPNALKSLSFTQEVTTSFKFKKS